MKIQLLEKWEKIELFEKINNEFGDLLEDPMKNKSPEQINMEIYEVTLHLFLILKRNEYIGYDEILNRISEYENDISELLDLSEDMMGSFKEFLEKVKNHEELLLCGLNDYRDHFMHQFHVFVSGYIIINKLGIDVFRSKIKGIITEENNNEPSSKSAVLRIWFQAAFYHDYAYILEKIDKEMKLFFKDVLGYPFTVEFKWDQLLAHKSKFPKYLNHLVNYFAIEGETDQGTLLRSYLDSIINSHDHGVLSALLLIHYHPSVSTTPGRFNECIHSALAISLHNKTVYEKVKEGDQESKGSYQDSKGSYQDSKGSDRNNIYFESFPIAFLLAFCDTAQAFGRLEGKDHLDLSDYPVIFSGIEVKSTDIENNENRTTLTPGKIKIIYKLKYIPQLGKIPSSGQLEKWAKKINTVFKSKDYLFEIEYYRTDENELDSKNENNKRNSKKEKNELIYTLSFH